MVVVRSLELESVSTMAIGGGVYSLVQSFDFKDWAAKKGHCPYEDLVVDFLPMPEGRDSYADIARRYREEQLAKGRVRPLAERAKESETLKYSAESIFVRVKHGWKALYTSWYPALGMASKAVDRLVPLWQLVYHGIILSNPFYATIDAYYERSGKNYSDSMQRVTYLDNAATRILKLHEFGGRPIFYYTHYEDIAPVKRRTRTTRSSRISSISTWTTIASSRPASSSRAIPTARNWSRTIRRNRLPTVADP